MNFGKCFSFFLLYISCKKLRFQCEGIFIDSLNRLFRLKFGRIQELKDQKAEVGGVAILKHESRYIYNLVTKKDAYKKPTYDDLKSALMAMKEHMVS